MKKTATRAKAKRSVERVREGTLDKITIDLLDTDDVEAQRALQELLVTGIAGLDDFLTKADKLAEALDGQSPLRTEGARDLRLNLKDIRRALEATDGLSQERAREVAYSAIGAALTFARLRGELRDDSYKRDDQRFTRVDYFNAKKKAKTRDELAALLHISPQRLRTWEKKYVR